MSNRGFMELTGAELAIRNVHRMGYYFFTRGYKGYLNISISFQNVSVAPWHSRMRQVASCAWSGKYLR
jgi:hypothetical protein